MTLNVTGSIYDQTDKHTAGGRASDIAQATTLKESGRITVQTSEVDLNKSTEVASPGWCLLKNAGATDRIDLGFATTVYDMSLEPGESTVFRLISTGSARIFVKAEGANDSNNLEFAFYAI